jgi:hypothetical protein
LMFLLKEPASRNTCNPSLKSKTSPPKLPPGIQTGKQLDKGKFLAYTHTGCPSQLLVSSTPIQASADMVSPMQARTLWVYRILNKNDYGNTREDIDSWPRRR